MPEMARSVVVLPAPLPPMRVTMLPAGTVNEMPWRAVMAPYWTLRLWTSSTARIAKLGVF